MATATGKLGLTKPAASENVDISVINNNMDLLDAAVGDLSPMAMSRGSIASGSDLNSYTVPGIYSTASNAVAATLTHCPSSVSFMMIVGQRSGQPLQILIPGAGVIFARGMIASVWGSWQQFDGSIVDQEAVSDYISGLVEAIGEAVASIPADYTALQAAVSRLGDENRLFSKTYAADLSPIASLEGKSFYLSSSENKVKFTTASGCRAVIVDIQDVPDQIRIGFDSAATFPHQAILGMADTEAPCTCVLFYTKSNLANGHASLAGRGFDVSTVAQGYYTIDKAMLLNAVPTLKALAINFPGDSYMIEGVTVHPDREIEWMQLADGSVREETVDGTFRPYTRSACTFSFTANCWYNSSAKIASAGAQTGTRGAVAALSQFTQCKLYVSHPYQDSFYGTPLLLGEGGDAGVNTVFYFTAARIQSDAYFDASHWESDGYYVIDTAALAAAHPTATHAFFNLPVRSEGLFACEENAPKALQWLTVTESNLDGDLQDAVERAGGIVRSYFRDEVADTAQKIMQKSAAPCVTLAFVTDTHEQESNAEKVRITNEMFVNVAAVCREAVIDGIVHGGDILWPDSETENPDWDTVNRHFLRFVNNYRKANPHVYILTGNHDGAGGTRPNQNNSYAALQKYNESYVQRPGNAPYFYHDYEKEKVRVIFLSTSNYNATYTIRHGIENDQYVWLRDTALNVENGWSVLIFGHIHPYSASVDWVNRSNFEGLCNAFNGHTSFTDSTNTVKDFSGRTAKIAAYIAGHAHYDMVISDDTVFTGYCLPFPIILTACSLMATTTPPTGGTSPGRTARTASQDLWDVLVYRPDLNKIFAIRFGAGNDREISVT